MMKKLFLTTMLVCVSLQAEEIYATFNVEAVKSANLAFTTSGTVNHVNVAVGSVLKQGDVLASLENSDLKAALNIADTALTFTKKDYERQLKVKNLVDAARLDSYTFKYESAKAKRMYQQALLDKTILKAPFDGVIYEKLVEVGDVVSGAMIRTVLKIQSIHARKLVLEIDQKYWKRLKIGETFTYTLTGEKRQKSGKITKIYPTSNPKNRKMKAEVFTQDIPVGLFGEGTIEIPEVK